MMPRRKTNDEFFVEWIDFFCKSGEKLSAVSPDIYDEYDDHSLLKLIAIKYWVDFSFLLYSGNLNINSIIK